MPPEESGRLLLDRMRARVGLDSLDHTHLLDFGCGVRFSQAILNTPLAIGGYTGVDNYREMIEFLETSVDDPRFRYVFLDAHHPLYNTSGERLGSHTKLPLPESSFDLAAMFSVITHQNPDDSRAIFTLLRRYVKSTGHLFFTCFLDEALESFEDRSPERNGGMCFYRPDFLVRLVEECGWREVNRAPSEGPLIGASFVFAPA